MAYTKIIFPESDVWSQDLTLQTNAMLDSAVAPLVGIIANHNYDNGVAAITNWGKALWETEVSTFDAYDGSITNGIYWAARIHSFLTVAQVNAWHYWWLHAGDNEGLADGSYNPAKRSYVLGNYARFVRPNYYRIGAANNSPALVSAFKDPASSNFVIVAANTNVFPVNQTFTLTNFPVVGLLRQWVTSGTESLGNHGGAITTTSGVFSAVLPPLTVTMFVYQQPVTNSPVIFQQPASQVIYPGGTVSFSIQAAGGTIPLYYQWLFNGTNVVIGATNATLNLTAVAATNAGNYSVLVTNYAGSITSGVASLGLNTLVWNTPVTISSTNDISTNGALLYAYNDSGSSAPVNGVNFTGVNSYTTWGTGVTLGSGWSATTTASYAGGASPPWSVLPGNYQTVLQGGAWNNGGAATVTLNNLMAGHQYQVQVWVNDSRSGGTTNRTETLTDAFGNTVTLAYNSSYAAGGLGQYAIGTFTGTATNQSFTMNSASSTQLNAIQVRDLTLAPGITQQPTNQTAYVNGLAAFAVTATGSAPLNYQWFFNTNSPVVGATNANLSLTALAATNAGTYLVVVTNYGGSSTSTFATLTVLPLPHPVITSVIISGTNLVCTGTNGASAGSPFYTLTSTNLATALTNWPVIATNSFGAGGSFAVTNPFDLHMPQSFMILKLP